ncbi:hypothetical protein ACHAWX_002343 [Stephanocyclus meneghinianus]
MRSMDHVGFLDVDYPSISTPRRTTATFSTQRYPSSNNVRTDDNISLWQTFKLLYKRNPTMKYYVIGLLMLLAGASLILGLSLSNRSTQAQDCSAASYNSEPFLILPQNEQSRQMPGEFGTSLDSSSNFLIIGDPNPKCPPQTEGKCANFTVGGAAYLYQKNAGNGGEHWILYSQFVLDDKLTSGDKFGTSVSISEDSKTIVVGSPMDDGLAVTAGAIYVMEEPFDDVVSPLRLVSDDIGAYDEFGGSVGVSLTTLPSSASNKKDVKVTNIVVGAPADDDFGSSSGGLYVFSKFEDTPVDGACGGQKISVNEWIQCQKLLPDDGGTLDRFGRAVDIADRTIVVGTDWDDDMGIDAGAVYVYSLGDDGNWGLQQKILPTNSDSTANKFGNAVSTSGDVIIVGADLDDSQGVDSGAAYVYRLSKGGVWSLDSKLITIDDNPVHDGYACGTSVDVSSDGKTIVVGCPKAPGGGVAFVYNFENERVWVQNDFFVYQDFYAQGSARLGESVTAQPSENGMVVTGYGLNGEVFSFSKNC